MKLFLRKFWREWVRPVALMFAVVAPLKSAVVDWNWVPTGSMKPSILEGELVLVNKLAYDLKVPFTTWHVAEWSHPRRGDVVVFFSPVDGQRLVKRVIGLPGDTIEMRDEVLFLNGVAQQYTVQDPAPYLRDIFEDRRPVVAIEHLKERDHLVMALPRLAALRSFGPLVVPPGEYFMLGDSRDNSNDSRFYGSVPRKQIVGRANGVILSVDPQRFFLPRPKRFFEGLDAKGT